MTELTWQAPPPRRGGKGFGDSELAVAARELRLRPNEWALVKQYEKPTTASSQCTYINRGGGIWGPEGTYEACTRAGTDLYVRYIGGGE